MGPSGLASGASEGVIEFPKHCLITPTNLECRRGGVSRAWRAGDGSRWLSKAFESCMRCTYRPELEADEFARSAPQIDLHLSHAFLAPSNEHDER